MATAIEVQVALRLARDALHEVEAFKWPAHCKKEGDCIAAGEIALRMIIQTLSGEGAVREN
jgi:hypothetical protein